MLRFIGDNFSAILYASGFLLSNIIIVKHLLQRKQLIKSLNQTEKKPILTIEEALKASKTQNSNDKKNSFLIKVFPKTDRPQIAILKQLPSNQLWLLEPSLKKISTQVVNLINKCFFQKKKKYIDQFQNEKIWFNPKWIAKTAESAESEVQINGFGCIIDTEMFEVKYKYFPKQSKGFFTSIRENLAYFFQFILCQNYDTFTDQNKLFRLSQNRSPFIKGPIIGHLLYLFEFMSGMPIIIEAKIQKEKIITICMATSKQKIIQRINQKITNSNYTILFHLIFSYGSYKFLQSKIKRPLKKFIKKCKRILGKTTIKNPIRPQVFKSKSQLQLDQKKLCIICYTNCRNLIFFDCKHLIMCDECKQIYQDHACPLCKQTIKEDKILYNS